MGLSSPSKDFTLFSFIFEPASNFMFEYEANLLRQCGDDTGAG